MAEYVVNNPALKSFHFWVDPLFRNEDNLIVEDDLRNKETLKNKDKLKN